MNEQQDMQAIIIYSDVIRGYEHIGFAYIGDVTEEQWETQVKRYFQIHKEVIIYRMPYKKVSELLECLEYRSISKDDRDSISTCFGDKMNNGFFGTFPVCLLEIEAED